MGTRRQSGSAMPTVLALISVILVAGLAMGSLSTLSLQFQKRTSRQLQAEFAARSALALFIAETRGLGEKDFNPLERDNKTMGERFSQPFEHEVEGRTVTIHFNSGKPGYSTDNLFGEKPAFGWPDSDVPQVPPFGLDLILNIDDGSGIQRFRATLERQWPFAVYTNAGPIVLTSQKDRNGSNAVPSKVEGDVYTSSNYRPPKPPKSAPSPSKPINSFTSYGINNPFGTTFSTGSGNLSGGNTPFPGMQSGGMPSSGNSSGNTSSSAVSSGTDPSAFLGQAPKEPYDSMTAHAILNALQLKAGFQPLTFPSVPLCVGSDNMVYRTPPEPVNLTRTNREVVYRYDPEDIEDFEEQEYTTGIPLDSGNELKGDFYLGKENKITAESAVGSGGNTFDGKIHRRKDMDLSDVLEKEDSELQSALESAQFQTISTDSAPFNPNITNYYNGFTEASGDVMSGSKETSHILEDTLVLREHDGTHFVIEGDVSNRMVLSTENSSPLGQPGILVREIPAGLDLEGVTLHVKGDLDLGTYKLEDQVPIRGREATLIVDGTLTLGNAVFEGTDRDFVIFAESVVFAGGGSFFGLIMAREDIYMQSGGGDKLHIEGGLIAGGERGIVIRGAEIKHNPKFLKSMNGAGNFEMVQWQKLN